jgi:outer membrane beta-barrel protein
MKSKLLSFILCATFLFVPVLKASEKDIYEFSWLDPDKEVYVLQNRKFRKVNHPYLNLGGGITTSGAFVDSTAIQGRVGYFFTENFGFEGLYSKNSGKENDTAATVRPQPGTAGSKPFRRIVDSYMGGMVLWSPFYSKINTFNKIIYMDWVFGLGYAQLKEHNNRLEIPDATSTTTPTFESHSGLIWDVGMKFYIDESFSIRTDLTAIHYSATKVLTTGTAINSNFDATLALGYAF